MDQPRRTLYIADTGNNAVLKVNLETERLVGEWNGARTTDIKGKGQYQEFTVNKQTIATVPQPSGLALYRCLLFVASHKTGVITVLNLSYDPPRAVGELSTGIRNLSGIAISPDGSALWAVSHAPQLVRIDYPTVSLAAADVACL
jgi:sugar lactone lactonase YvrE